MANNKTLAHGDNFHNLSPASLAMLCDKKLLREYNFHHLLRYAFLPLYEVNGELTVVLALNEENAPHRQVEFVKEPNPDEINFLKLTLNRLQLFKVCRMPRQRILRAIELIYQKDGSELNRVTSQLERFISDNPTALNNQPHLTIAYQTPDAGDEQRQVLDYFLISLITHAYSLNCSDIHIMTKRDQNNGELGHIVLKSSACRYTYERQISKGMLEILFRKLKVQSKLSPSPVKEPLDGSFTLDLASGRVHLRTAFVPSLLGENCTLRLFSEETKSLGAIFGNNKAEVLSNLRPGLVIISGHTGAGKTTTAYALLKELALQDRHIITVEDPPEVIIPEAMQLDASKHGFAELLKGTLRHAPDVVMVGEIRDSAVATEVIKMSLTGHLIIATLHAGDMHQVFARLTMLGIDERALMNSVSMIISQSRHQGRFAYEIFVPNRGNFRNSNQYFRKPKFFLRGG